MMVDRTWASLYIIKAFTQEAGSQLSPGVWLSMSVCGLVYCGASCAVGWSDLVECFSND